LCSPFAGPTPRLEGAGDGSRARTAEWVCMPTPLMQCVRLAGSCGIITPHFPFCRLKAAIDAVAGGEWAEGARLRAPCCGGISMAGARPLCHTRLHYPQFEKHRHRGLRVADQAAGWRPPAGRHAVADGRSCSGPRAGPGCCGSGGVCQRDKWQARDTFFFIAQVLSWERKAEQGGGRTPDKGTADGKSMRPTVPPAFASCVPGE